MKILLSTLTALLLIGCSGEQKAAQSDTEAPAAAVQKSDTPAAPAAAAPEPAAAPAPAAEEPQPAVAETPAVDGAMLFKQKCASCHGQKAEKSALNVSQAIRGWEASKVVEALKGYKLGNYGGSMKGMMQGQVRTLSDAQVEALALFVSQQ